MRTKHDVVISKICIICAFLSWTDYSRYISVTEGHTDKQIDLYV